MYSKIYTSEILARYVKASILKWTILSLDEEGGLRIIKIFLAMCEKLGDFYDNLFDCIDRHEQNYNEDDGLYRPSMTSFDLEF